MLPITTIVADLDLNQPVHGQVVAITHETLESFLLLAEVQATSQGKVVLLRNQNIPVAFEGVEVIGRQLAVRMEAVCPASAETQTWVYVCVQRHIVPHLFFPRQVKRQLLQVATDVVRTRPLAMGFREG